MVKKNVINIFGLFYKNQRYYFNKANLRTKIIKNIELVQYF